MLGKNLIKEFFSSKNIVNNRVLNILGIQIVRVFFSAAVYEIRYNLNLRKIKNDKLKEDVRKLKKNGYLVINNFLDEDASRKVYKEYQALITRNDLVETSVDGVGIKTIKIKGIKQEMLNGPIFKNIYISDYILEVISAAQGWPKEIFQSKIRKGYQLFRSLNSKEEVHSHEMGTTSTDFHSDTYFHLFKVFYAFCDVSNKNAATRFIEESTSLSLYRLYLEYVSSIRRSGGSSFLKEAEIKNYNKNIVDVEVNSNSLIIIDTFGIHARGKFINNEMIRDYGEIHFYSKPYSL